MKKLFAVFALAGSSLFGATHFSFGVNIGGARPGYYAPAPVYAAPVYAAPAYGYGPAYVENAYPDPGSAWVDGYWNYPGYGRRVWVPGYRRPPVRSYGNPYRNNRFDYRFRHR